MRQHEVAQDVPLVETLTEVAAQDVEDFARLLPQLSSKALPSMEVIAERLQAAANPENEDSRVVVIRDESGRIQASATGNICRIPTGEKAWIDDVVTDKEHRGKRYGRQLMESLHEWFAERGISSVNLTSRPTRGEAGNLYESMDYAERDTRVYRKPLGAAAVASATA